MSLKENIKIISKDLNILEESYQNIVENCNRDYQGFHNELKEANCKIEELNRTSSSMLDEVKVIKSYSEKNEFLKLTETFAVERIESFYKLRQQQLKQDLSNLRLELVKTKLSLSTTKSKDISLKASLHGRNLLILSPKLSLTLMTFIVLCASYFSTMG